ncbi:MAG: OmpH family outer membrane protein [Bacteroidales bacterium]
MKKIFLIAAMALLTLSASAQTAKFGHVNFSELVQLMPEADSARAQINASSKEANETYQSMTEEFQAKAQQYQQKSATWTPAVKKSKEDELTDIQNRIQQFEQTVQQELQNQQNQLMAPIYKKAQDEVSALAKAKGLVFVFDAASVLYVDSKQSVDLTAEARKALNIRADRTLEALQKELQAQAQTQQQ